MLMKGTSSSRKLTDKDEGALDDVLKTLQKGLRDPSKKKSVEELVQDISLRSMVVEDQKHPHKVLAIFHAIIKANNRELSKKMWAEVPMKEFMEFILVPCLESSSTAPNKESLQLLVLETVEALTWSYKFKKVCVQSRCEFLTQLSGMLEDTSTSLKVKSNALRFLERLVFQFAYGASGRFSKKVFDHPSRIYFSVTPLLSREPSLAVNVLGALHNLGFYSGCAVATVQNTRLIQGVLHIVATSKDFELVRKAIILLSLLSNNVEARVHLLQPSLSLVETLDALDVSTCISRKGPPTKGQKGGGKVTDENRDYVNMRKTMTLANLIGRSKAKWDQLKSLDESSMASVVKLLNQILTGGNKSWPLVSPLLSLVSLTALDSMRMTFGSSFVDNLTDSLKYGVHHKQADCVQYAVQCLSNYLYDAPSNELLQANSKGIIDILEGFLSIAKSRKEEEEDEEEEEAEQAEDEDKKEEEGGGGKVDRIFTSPEAIRDVQSLLWALKGGNAQFNPHTGGTRVSSMKVTAEEELGGNDGDDDEEEEEEWGEDGDESMGGSMKDTEVPSKMLVMISYNWGMQPRAKEIAKCLKEMGFEYWLDLDHMNGDVMGAMANAILTCHAVLVLASNGYVQSANCRREATFAAERKKKIIPIMCEDVDLDCWLGILISGVLRYSSDQVSIRSLLEDIVSKEFATSSEELSPASSSSAKKESARRTSIHWPKDISVWLREKGLESMEASLKKRDALDFLTLQRLWKRQLSVNDVCTLFHLESIPLACDFLDALDNVFE